MAKITKMDLETKIKLLAAEHQRVKQDILNLEDKVNFTDILIGQAQKYVKIPGMGL